MRRFDFVRRILLGNDSFLLSDECDGGYHRIPNIHRPIHGIIRFPDGFWTYKDTCSTKMYEYYP